MEDRLKILALKAPAVVTHHHQRLGWVATDVDLDRRVGRRELESVADEVGHDLFQGAWIPQTPRVVMVDEADAHCGFGIEIVNHAPHDHVETSVLVTELE